MAFDEHVVPPSPLAVRPNLDVVSDQHPANRLLELFLPMNTITCVDEKDNRRRNDDTHLVKPSMPRPRCAMIVHIAP
ncbi:MAG: hypothetical protein WAN43_15435 [Rhodomicrobium sp.]